MRAPRTLSALVALVAITILSAHCAAARQEPGAPRGPLIAHPAPEGEAAAVKGDKGEEKPVLVGPQSREKIEAAVPEWVQVEVESAPDPQAVKALAAVPPGARVTVFLGTWCGDSRREVSRLWRALDEAGGSVPFAIDYVCVDHDKKDPGGLAGPAAVQYVPTFVVSRGGREVGRIVESAPHGVEKDLLALLDGSAHGLLTGRDDLGAGSQPHG